LLVSVSAVCAAFLVLFVFFVCVLLLPPCSALFPYTTLFRSLQRGSSLGRRRPFGRSFVRGPVGTRRCGRARATADRRGTSATTRSEEHTSELQSRFDLVCRLLLEKKKK